MLSVIEQRKSVRQYDPTATISKEQLTKLLQAAGKAPSAWNLQHWHFIVFYGKEAQQKLLPIAYNQQQIVEASAVVAVLGDLQAHQKIDAVYDPLVAEGKMTKDIKETLAKQIESAYTNAQYARDAAFTNASLAAMQFMLAAKAEGFDTCAIGGFDTKAFMDAFNIPSRYVPVMLITVGKAAAPAHSSYRLPIDELTTWIQ